MAKPNKKENQFRINEDIKIFDSVNVRIIGNGENKVVLMKQAKELADTLGLDIIEINGNAEIPILRIEDYGKFLYEIKKKQKASKQQVSQLKEIQLSPNIAKHDLETKVNQAKRFLADGDKVRVVLSMRGRELMRREENKRSLYEFIVALENDSTISAEPKDEGNKTSAILSPKKKK